MKKYTEATQNRTVCFYKEDLDTLSAHATHKNSVTDMIQEAIKNYITAQGWNTDQGEQENRTRQAIQAMLEKERKEQAEKTATASEATPDQGMSAAIQASKRRKDNER